MTGMKISSKMVCGICACAISMPSSPDKLVRISKFGWLFLGYFELGKDYFRYRQLPKSFGPDLFPA